MSNKNLFGSKKKAKKATRAVVVVNKSGGLSYDKGKEEALAQLAVTGCFNNTFYSTAEEQLDKVIELSLGCTDVTLANMAVYSRSFGFMKDMPALLMAILSVRDPSLFRQFYPRVINNAKMIRNLIQMVRSGKVGRKSLGSTISNSVAAHLNRMTDQQLLNATVGNDPSLKDIIRLAHPKPKDAARQAAFKWIMGYPAGNTDSKKTYRYDDLPSIFKEFEEWKKDKTRTIPVVDFQLITGQELTDNHWLQLAANGNWHFTRMNLNTFDRHNVLKDKKMVKVIADRLKDETMVARSRVFPYQIYTAIKHNTVQEKAIQNALEDALDLTVKNIPEMKGKIAIFIDGSGSMGTSVTGNREGATSSMSCLQAACLIGAGIYKKNSGNADLHIFDTNIKFDSASRNSAIDSTKRLGEITAFVESKSQSGGTSVSCCLEHIKNDNYDIVIVISDNESWADYYSRYSATVSAGLRAAQTKTQELWRAYNKSGDKKLVLIDLSPNTMSQASTSDDVMNIGGFSNVIFNVMSAFVSRPKGVSWVDLIKTSIQASNSQDNDSE